MPPECTIQDISGQRDLAVHIHDQSSRKQISVLRKLDPIFSNIGLNSLRK